MFSPIFPAWYQITRATDLQLKNFRTFSPCPFLRRVYYLCFVILNLAVWFLHITNLRPQTTCINTFVFHLACKFLFSLRLTQIPPPSPSRFLDSECKPTCSLRLCLLLFGSSLLDAIGVQEALQLYPISFRILDANLTGSLPVGRASQPNHKHSYVPRG